MQAGGNSELSLWSVAYLPPLSNISLKTYPFFYSIYYFQSYHYLHSSFSNPVPIAPLESQSHNYRRYVLQIFSQWNISLIEVWLISSFALSYVDQLYKTNTSVLNSHRKCHHYFQLIVLMITQMFVLKSYHVESENFLSSLKSNTFFSARQIFPVPWPSSSSHSQSPPATEM